MRLSPRFKPTFFFTRMPGPRPATSDKSKVRVYSQAVFGPPFFLVLIDRIPAAVAGGLMLCLAGCAALPAPEPAQAATVRADPAISAGLPVQLRLRKVDDTVVPLWQHSVQLAPGSHEFIIDCKVLESGATARFAISAELEPRGDYRVVAVANARNCETVEIAPR